MLRVVGLWSLVLMVAICGAAQTTVDQQEPTASDELSVVSKPKVPTAAPDAKPIFQFGFDERFRPEDMNNYSDANGAIFDTQHRWRVRTRVWGQLAITDSVDLYVRLANEWRKTSSPDTKLSRSFPDEIVFDNAYLDFKRLFVKGLSLRVGRQDMRRGEGFILGDGTALDGSRTGYLNGVDLAYATKKSKLELLGLVQPKRDHYLPRINDQDKLLVEYNEGLVGAYFTDTHISSIDIDAYYFLKRESGDERSVTSVVFTPDRHVHTIGGRVVNRLSKSVTATGEFAYQFGAQRGNYATGAPAATISGWGGFGSVTKSFEHVHGKPYVTGGYFAVSGDDYGTANKVEGWDPLFARFAIKSDLLFNAFKTEKGTGYWTNLRMPQFTLGMKPNKRFNWYASYMYVDAFHPFSIGSRSIFGTGTHRGSLLFSRAELQLSDGVATQFQYESMWSGNYYESHDRSYYFRAQVLYTWTGKVGRRK